MDSEHPAETLEERPWRQRAACADPFVRIGNGAYVKGQEGADRTDTNENGAPIQVHALPKHVKALVYSPHVL
jgi:hypothetical protein